MTQADVVVPVYADVALTQACLKSVLERSGASLRRLIVIDDRGPEAAMAPMLDALASQEPRVRLLRNELNLGFVEAANRGLMLREGHVVVLNSDAVVSEGWLEGLLDVLALDERFAAVCPLSNDGTFCSVPNYMERNPGAAVPTAVLSALPQFTLLPTGVGFCMLLRSEALDHLGAFDARYSPGYHEENDWCQRAQAAGYLVARANRVHVQHVGGVSFGSTRAKVEPGNLARLVGRYPRYLRQMEAYEGAPQARVAARAVASLQRPLKVRVLADADGLDFMPGDLEGIEVERSTHWPADACDVLHVARPVSSLDEVGALLGAPAALTVSADALRLAEWSLADEASWELLEEARVAASALLSAAQGVTEAVETSGSFRLAAALPGQVKWSADGALVHLAINRHADHEPLLLEAYVLAQSKGAVPPLVLTSPGPQERLPRGVTRLALAQSLRAPWSAGIVLSTHPLHGALASAVSRAAVPLLGGTHRVEVLAAQLAQRPTAATAPSSVNDDVRAWWVGLVRAPNEPSLQRRDGLRRLFNALRRR